MPLLLVFAVLVAAWWVVAAVADWLLTHHVRVPDRWVVHIQPGWLPAYARKALKKAR